MFPRHACRGLIEAAIRAALRYLKAPFPRHACRGLIEAHAARSSAAFAATVSAACVPRPH